MGIFYFLNNIYTWLPPKSRLRRPAVNRNIILNVQMYTTFEFEKSEVAFCL